MGYCLDTNVFIEAHRNYYAFDLAPIFWDTLSEWGRQSIIFSPIVVYDELKESGDDLANWAKNNKADLFFDTNPDPDTTNAYSDIANFVNQRYEPQHVAKFLDDADSWVIASALAKDLIVVTMESLKNEQISRTSGKVAGRIKIPNICNQFGVKYNNTFQLLRDQGFKFN